ncbi:LuxR C-terminal-related transcriptional regulator [uncultured Jannaschia sp.]|uniref:helix-turn-helix transcriptional regulator n=1 Tax=uncultured Jannaschia sp. TaxID=293347 RepID=UPI00262EA330|nr:LuxR C-terminal-related transcriptional regulator [uncultured Jannaschia sp.]
MNQPASAARLSDLIGFIYDCAFDPGLWPAAMDALRTEMHFATAVLSSYALPSGRVLLNIESGIDSDWAARMRDYEREIIDLWGGTEVALNFPVGKPAVLSHINPRAFEPPVHRYIAEWGWPQGLIDTMAVVVARDGNSVGSLAFGRHAAEGPIGEGEVALAQLLAPHIQRSVAIGHLLEMTAVASASGTVIDRLAVPVILMARDRLILYVNEAARALLQDSAALTSHGNRLTSPDPNAARLLRDAIEQCARDEARFTGGASGFPLRDRDGRVHAVHVLPLGPGNRWPSLARSAIAAVLVSRPAGWAGGVTDAVAALFGLTGAETRVFSLIASGSTPAAAATALGVAPSTLRTHLVRIYDKTGAHRQADLVRLAAGMVSPLADLEPLRDQTGLPPPKPRF